MIRNVLKKIDSDNEFQKRILIGILIFHFLLRFGLSFTQSSELKWYDEKNYHSIAVSIANGEGFESTYNPISTPRWAPLQGYILAGIYSISGNSLFWARLVQIIFSTILCFMIFWLGRQIFNRFTGLLSSLIFASHPVFIYISNLIYPESNFTFFMVLLAVLLVHLMRKESGRNKIIILLIAIGLVWGQAMLSRPVAIFLTPMFLLVFLFSSRFGFVKSVLYFLMVLISTGITLSPWIYYTSQKYDKLYFITTEGALSFYAANNPDFTLEMRSSENLPEDLEQKLFEENKSGSSLIADGFGFIFKNPVDFIKSYASKFVNFWRVYPNTKSKNEDTSSRNIIVSSFFYSSLFVLFFIGLLWSLPQWRKNLIIYCFIFLFAIGYSFFITTVRYRLPVEPFILLISSYAVYKITEKFKLI
jgi:4-amino-4-deoxy-L-arabinose transferase-like glycosyltransferase